MSLAFLLTSLIVVVAPGAGVLYTLSAGLSRGARASVFAALGCTLGILPHMAAAITGLAALLYASSVAFEALKILGCIYLFYSLPVKTQLFFLAAQGIGLVLYFIYGHGAAAKARANG